MKKSCTGLLSKFHVDLVFKLGFFEKEAGNFVVGFVSTLLLFFLLLEKLEEGDVNFSIVLDGGFARFAFEVVL